MTVFAAEKKITGDKFRTWINAPGKNHNGTNWTPLGQNISNLFDAFHIGSFTVKHICDMLIAINQLRVDDREYFEGQVQAILTQLCRAKVLRSRQSQGKKLYEVNY